MIKPMKNEMKMALCVEVVIAELGDDKTDEERDEDGVVCRGGYRM